jgi:hypothetical protein
MRSWTKLFALTLVVLSTPVVADEITPAATPLPAFLTRPAATPLPARCDDGAGPLKAALVGAPQPVPMTHCVAQQTCPNTCFIQCTGHGSCLVGATSVTCDGVTTECPYPTCDPSDSCLDGCCFCECRAAGGGPWACFRGCCQ